jgi:hypothetical protein
MTDIKFTAFEFQVDLDQDDPDLVADLSINEWQKTDSAKWLLEHSNIAKHRCKDPASISLHYKIVSTITPEKYTFWSLTYK